MLSKLKCFLFSGRALFFYFVIIMGGLMLYLFWVEVQKSLYILEVGKAGKAVISSVSESENSVSITIRYKALDPEKEATDFLVKTSIYFADLHLSDLYDRENCTDAEYCVSEGDSVAILYNPQNPEQAIFNTTKNQILYSPLNVGAFLMGIFMVLGGLMMLFMSCFSKN